MKTTEIVPWTASQVEVVPRSAKTAGEIAQCARQLTKNDIQDIVAAFEQSRYEMGTTFVWQKAMSGLRRQLATLGMEFIGEMLQRPDIGANSDIRHAVTDFEAISLAEDLGMIGPTEAMRLRHAHQVVVHFAESDRSDSEETSMTHEEAVSCLRACVQNILGQPRLEVARNFSTFRHQLEEKSLSADDPHLQDIASAPYFFLRTTTSVLLALLRTTTGAQLEHVASNTKCILPLVWEGLRKPERWQVGQTYAALHAEGKKTAVTALKAALLTVHGFDYVPENLRSNTFMRAAKDVLAAHEGMNNFYNEPAPMKVLAGLGTSIPDPALSACVTAALCVRLGNFYGICYNAQGDANKVLRGLSQERCAYYLDDCLPSDKRILYKLTEPKPTECWLEVVAAFDLTPDMVRNSLVRKLIEASRGRKGNAIRAAAQAMYVK